MDQEPPKDLTVEQWEKKAELALRNGDLGNAMKFSLYADLAGQEG